MYEIVIDYSEKDKIKTYGVVIFKSGSKSKLSSFLYEKLKISEWKNVKKKKTKFNKKVSAKIVIKRFENNKEFLKQNFEVLKGYYDLKKLIEENKYFFEKAKLIIVDDSIINKIKKQVLELNKNCKIIKESVAKKNKKDYPFIALADNIANLFREKEWN